MAEARHAGARVVGLGVVELAPGVLDDRLGGRAGRIGDAAQLAVVVQARADGAEGDLLLADLVAVVAVAAVGGGVGRRSVQVMPRPFCASCSPSCQSPMNCAVGRQLHRLQVLLLDRLPAAPAAADCPRPWSTRRWTRPAAAGRPWRCLGRGTMPSPCRRSARRSRARAPGRAAGQHEQRSDGGRCVSGVHAFLVPSALDGGRDRLGALGVDAHVRRRARW